MAENTSNYTSTTRKNWLDWFGRNDGFEAETEKDDEILQSAMQEHEGVYIDAYVPYLKAPNSWLPRLEDRIRESILPDEYEGEPSPEWLRPESALAAIAFFRNGVDLLPTEPHIYANRSGNLVAEFETEKGNMTSVVTDKETILFVVLASDPSEPNQFLIRRGSNQFRDELRSITENLDLGSHGQMETE